jgi:hypothetical protein
MNVEDLAASRWKPIRQAHEQIAKATAAHARSSARLEELRGQVGPAERRDRDALGRALVDGKSEPASEATLLAVEIECEERRLEALAVAVQDAHGQIGKVVDANRGDWRRQAMQELSRAQRRYTGVIDELAVAREGLDDEAALLGWLSSGVGVAATLDTLGGRGVNGALSFRRVLEELRRDADAIAVHPAVHHPDPPRAWQTVREQAERLVGRGLTREEALRQADPGWEGE